MAYPDPGGPSAMENATLIRIYPNLIFEEGSDPERIKINNPSESQIQENDTNCYNIYSPHKPGRWQPSADLPTYS
jgi:hypothetical protein